MAVIGSLSMIMLLSQQATAADLTLNISDIEPEKGHIMVALYADQASYANGKANFTSKIKADLEQTSIIFDNLPDGEYAVKLYQDENDNSQLDFNMMGIPKEGYGFSNNVGRFGAPKYNEAKFTIKKNTTITIELF
jgi:uncharacterized protein (DUF2141 family)